MLALVLVQEDITLEVIVEEEVFRRVAAHPEVEEADAEVEEEVVVDINQYVVYFYINTIVAYSACLSSISWASKNLL